MQENNAVSLREMLEQLPTSQLDEMLHKELHKEPPDPNAIRLILDILEEREKDYPVEMDARTEAAWAKYQQRIEGGVLRKKPVRNMRWLWNIATAAVIVLLLVAVVPQRAEAESLWDLLTRWSNSVLEFLNPGDKAHALKMKFETDNPGLQQVYDAAVELGIEDPLIPMWLPEEYVLSRCEIFSTPTTNYVLAVFAAGNKELVIKINKHNQDVFHGYLGEETYYKQFEREDAEYRITRNIDRWVAVWKIDNIEYFITLDCQEDTLQRILDSIYVMEEN